MIAGGAANCNGIRSAAPDYLIGRLRRGRLHRLEAVGDRGRNHVAGHVDHVRHMSRMRSTPSTIAIPSAGMFTIAITIIRSGIKPPRIPATPMAVTHRHHRDD